MTGSHEILLADDSGRDGEWDVIQSLREKCENNLVTIPPMGNYGEHNALTCGLGIARGEYAVTMDKNLRNPPKEIPKLLEKIKTHRLDLVYACSSFTVSRLGCDD